MSNNNSLCHKLSQKHALDELAWSIFLIPLLMILPALGSSQSKEWYEAIGGFSFLSALFAMPPRIFTVFVHCCCGDNDRDGEVSYSWL